MTYRKLLLIIAGISSLFFYSCKDYPTDIGANLLKNNSVDIKTLDSFVDSLSQNSSYFKNTIPLGNGTKLLLGNFENVQGSILLKYYFLFIPDSISSAFANDSIVINSATISLHPVLTFGDTTANLDFNVFKVNSSWGITTFDADSLPSLSYDHTEIATNKKITDSLTTFDIDKSLVTSWLKAYIDSNYTQINGIYIQPTSDSKKLVAFQAFNSLSGVYSELSVVFEKPGAYIDTVNFVPVQDISVVAGTLPQLKSSDIAVQGGLSLNSKLWFDVSKLPANSVINQATITLTIDSLYSKYDITNGNALTLWNLSDSTSNLIDSSKSVSIGLSGNAFTGDITALVQKWVNNRSNQGLVIHDFNPNEEVYLYAIKGSKDPDLTVRPRLKIIYTVRN